MTVHYDPEVGLTRIPVNRPGCGTPAAAGDTATAATAWVTCAHCQGSR